MKKVLAQNSFFNYAFPAMNNQPTTHRGSHLNFYNAPNFSLSVPKRDKKAQVFLSYVIGDPSVKNFNFQFSTVLVSRKEAAHALKNFKKVLDKSRATA